MYGYEEHLRDSAPDNSRFDGFCRGDVYPILPASAFDGERMQHLLSDEDIEFF